VGVWVFRGGQKKRLTKGVFMCYNKSSKGNSFFSVSYNSFFGLSDFSEGFFLCV
jgi:hypothetical protein